MTLLNRFSSVIHPAVLQFRDVSKLPLGFRERPSPQSVRAVGPWIEASDQQGRPLKEVADGHRYEGLQQTET
jgi:hypothetical protein